MARSLLSLIGLIVISVAHAQIPPAAFFNVPASPFNRGGRVSFVGSTLGSVCRMIMMKGGKDALSDGMGAAAKWFHSKKINILKAGGTDPQMQCLYAQATGSTMPGVLGGQDPGNIFGDYYDTVIEYPMVTDPCTAPQCNGKVNPSVLLMQTFAPMLRGGMGMMGMGMAGKMGGGMGHMGGVMGGANPMAAAMGGASAMAAAMGGANPMATMSKSPMMNALMPRSQSASPMGQTSTVGQPSQTLTATATLSQQPPAVASSPAIQTATATTNSINNNAMNTPLMNNNNQNMASLFQNSNPMVNMWQQMMLQQIMKQMGQNNNMAAVSNPMMQGNMMGGFTSGSQTGLPNMHSFSSFFS